MNGLRIQFKHSSGHKSASLELMVAAEPGLWPQIWLAQHPSVIFLYHRHGFGAVSHNRLSAFQRVEELSLQGISLCQSVAITSSTHPFCSFIPPRLTKHLLRPDTAIFIENPASA